MTLHDLLHSCEFDALVPHLTAIDPEYVPSNLYAFKEAFDCLRRMTPGDAHGDTILVSTEVDLDEDGNEVDRYLHASGCEGDFWEACLAKEVIFGTRVGKEKALAQILWHLTFWGFTPDQESFPRQTRNDQYEHIVRHLIDRIMSSNPGYALCPENRSEGVLVLDPSAEQVTEKRFRYLFDTAEICPVEFYSRSVLPAGRAAYISKNIADYYKADSAEYTRAIVLYETSAEHPLRLSEFKPLQASLRRVTAPCEHTLEHTCQLFGHNPSLGHDLHILIVFSR